MNNCCGVISKAHFSFDFLLISRLGLIHAALRSRSSRSQMHPCILVCAPTAAAHTYVYMHKHTPTHLLLSYCQATNQLLSILLKLLARLQICQAELAVLLSAVLTHARTHWWRARGETHSSMCIHIYICVYVFICILYLFFNRYIIHIYLYIYMAFGEQTSLISTQTLSVCLDFSCGSVLKA